MNRRSVISRLTLMGSGVLLGSSGLIGACKFLKAKRTKLTNDDLPLLDEIGETIIPTTSSSPGAKAAKIGAYMLVMVKDCYLSDMQVAFVEGLNDFDELCYNTFKKPFIELTSSQKKVFLIKLQAEANRFGKNNMDKNGKPKKHYFELLKELTISGYFTSEIGATRARRYEAIPGKFEGCISYKQGDRAWATS